MAKIKEPDWDKILEKEKLKHMEPAPKTLEMIGTINTALAKLETTVIIGFQGVNDKLDDNCKDHEEMKGGIKYTNGSVASLKLWQAYIKGSLAVLIFLVTIFGGLVINYVIKLRETNDLQKRITEIESLLTSPGTQVIIENE